MPEKITPEEKLLKLIENPAAEGLAQSPLRKIRSLFILSTIKNWLKVLMKIIKGIKLKKKPQELFNLKFVNKALVIISLLLSLYLILDFIKAKPVLAKIYSLRHVKQKGKIEKTGLSLNLSDYLNQISQRDIFHSLPVKSIEPKVKETLATLAGNLKLVGIIWGKFPQAMIEDKQENKTLLLNQGDEIGKLKIKQILRDRVILGYEDQEMELL